MAKVAKQSFTSASLAEAVGAPSPKALRVFLRSEASGVESVGKGGRYALEFTPTQLAKLTKAYEGWTAATAAKRAERAAALEEKAVANVAHAKSFAPTMTSEDEAIAELDDEPTDDELAELELDEADLEA